MQHSLTRGPTPPCVLRPLSPPLVLLPCFPAGARSDSYYEYLLKQWVLTGKKDGWLRERYVKAMHSVRSRCVAASVGRQQGSTGQQRWGASPGAGC